ncbi:MAG TPA: FtsK/SpoIIIE domain-containing protein, partial [Actinomycetales bacterium]
MHALRPGEHRLGRSPESEVVVADPGASRSHAVMTVSAAGVRVRDLGSVNGIALGDDDLRGTSADIVAGQRFRVGDTTLVLRSPAVRLATTRATGDGTVELNRAPRPAPSQQPVIVRRPATVSATPRQRWPLAAMLLPLGVAVPIALVTGQPIFLLFALMSPVMMVANVLSDRSRSRRDAREATAHWQEQTRDADERIERALVAELAARRAAAPDAGEVLRAVLRPSARLWERAPGSVDTLHLLVGTGRVPADVRVHGTDGSPEPLHLDDAPVVVRLPECGHLGVAGPRHVALGVVRHLLAQVVAWHGPQSVRLLLLTRDAAAAAEWGWARWLPHCHAPPLVHDAQQVQPALTALLETIAARRESRGSAAWEGTRTVVVIDGASTLRSVVGLAELMQQGPQVGVHVICLDLDLASLPSGVGATLDLQHRVGALVVEGGAACDVRWDAVGAGWAERAARALAPVRDATPSTEASGLPADVRLLDLLPCDATDPVAVTGLWAAGGASTRVVVGVDQDGPAVLDLRRDGPHALVAGTTGAGKSELLRTLVVALAVANRPDELSMVLVDYKGGAAFAGCAGLPHVSGVVTDLDAHLAERALESLGAELTRRERALAAAGCEDLEAYQLARGRDPSLAAVPRLVVVIDEFRMLAQELPSFVTGLVRVAAVGRSLGVHLVLATQRPAGIVSADIKANVSLRIALRLRDRSDSDDVIESGDAARLDPATPGRAVWRGGAGALRTVQVARISGCADTTDDEGITVRRSTPRGAHGPEAPPLPPGDAGRPPAGADDLARVTAAVRQAATDAGIVPAPAAWLPPLPLVLSAGDVPAATVGGGVVLGLVDLPQQQLQPSLTWHPARDGHLGVHGPSRSGRTSALTGVALGLSGALSPAELHLHVLDGAGGRLRDLRALP